MPLFSWSTVPEPSTGSVVWFGHFIPFFCYGVVHKSDVAEAVLDKTLAAAQWLNIHLLPPGDRPCFEVRTAEGYGIRWVYSGQFPAPLADLADPLVPRAAAAGEGKNAEVTFRGFLEPSMEDGHEFGWRH